MNGEFIHKVNKLTWLMIIFCLIGLIFMPLLPWISTEMNDKTYYMNEGDLSDGREYIEDTKKQLDDMPSSTKETDEYKDAKSLIDAALGMIDNVGGIGIFFWFSLFFVIILLIGIAVYNIGQKYQIIGNIMFIMSIFVLIFSLMIVLNHVFLIMNIGTINDKIDDVGSAMSYMGVGLFSNEITYSFNYIPFIMGILLLIISIMFVVSVVPTAIRSFSSRRPRPMGTPGGYPPQQQPPMQQQPMPPQQPPMQQQPPIQQQPVAQAPPPPPQQPPSQQPKPPAPRACTICGAPIKGNPKFCPKCGGKLQ